MRITLEVQNGTVHSTKSIVCIPGERTSARTAVPRGAAGASAGSPNPADARSSAANSSGGPSEAIGRSPSPAASTSDASTSASRSARSSSAMSLSEARTAAR